MLSSFKRFFNKRRRPNISSPVESILFSGRPSDVDPDVDILYSFLQGEASTSDQATNAPVSAEAQTTTGENSNNQREGYHNLPVRTMPEAPRSITRQTTCHDRPLLAIAEQPADAPANSTEVSMESLSDRDEEPSPAYVPLPPADSQRQFVPARDLVLTPGEPVSTTFNCGGHSVSLTTMAKTTTPSRLKKKRKKAPVNAGEPKITKTCGMQAGSAIDHNMDVGNQEAFPPLPQRRTIPPTDPVLTQSMAPSPGPPPVTSNSAFRPILERQLGRRPPSIPTISPTDDLFLLCPTLASIANEVAPENYLTPDEEEDLLSTPVLSPASMEAVRGSPIQENTAVAVATTKPPVTNVVTNAGNQPSVQQGASNYVRPWLTRFAGKTPPPQSPTPDEGGWVRVPVSSRSRRNNQHTNRGQPPGGGQPGHREPGPDHTYAARTGPPVDRNSPRQNRQRRVRFTITLNLPTGPRIDRFTLNLPAEAVDLTIDLSENSNN